MREFQILTWLGEEQVKNLWEAVHTTIGKSWPLQLLKSNLTNCMFSFFQSKWEIESLSTCHDIIFSSVFFQVLWSEENYNWDLINNIYTYIYIYIYIYIPQFKLNFCLFFWCCIMMKVRLDFGEKFGSRNALFMILLILYMILNASIIRAVNWFLK